MPTARFGGVLVVATMIIATAGVGAVAAASGAVVPTDPRPAGATGTPANATASATPRGSPTASGDVRVAPLRRVVPPDVLVVADRPLRSGQIEAVRELPGVVETTRVAAGTARIDSGRGQGRRMALLGVHPSTFRAWTPPASAASDALWRALARDQLVVSFRARRAHELHLGRTYDAVGAHVLSMRLGAVAALGLPDVDGLVTTASAGALGLTEHAGLLVNAPSARIGRLADSVRDAVGDDAAVRTLRRPSSRSTPEGTADPAPSGKPQTYRELYQQAALRCPGLSWTVLAAIGQVESGHGRNMGPSSAGALGPMQFLPSTWRTYGVDGDGDGRKDIANPYDAVPAAADYLCHAGAGNGGSSLAHAVFAYNHSDSYVRKVLAIAEQYAEAS